MTLVRYKEHGEIPDIVAEQQYKTLLYLVLRAGGSIDIPSIQEIDKTISQHTLQKRSTRDENGVVIASRIYAEVKNVRKQ